MSAPASAFLSVCGLRADGRRAHEVRRLRARVGVARGFDGSALVDAGGTRVLALVSGPRAGGAGAGAAGEAGAAVAVDFIVAPFAGAGERRARRPGDRGAAEAAAALGGVFEGLVVRALYPRAEIAVTVHVLASDGGALAAAVSAGALALADAGIALVDLAAGGGALASAAGPLADPSGAELAGGAPELVLALLPATGGALLATLDARLPADALAPLLAAAAAAARAAYDVVAAALREATARRVEAREGGAPAAPGGEGAGGGGGGGAPFLTAAEAAAAGLDARDADMAAD